MTKIKAQLQEALAKLRAHASIAASKARSLGSEMSESMRSPEARERAKLKLSSMREKLGANMTRGALLGHIQNFDPAALAERASKAFQRENAELYGLILTIVLCTWFLSDLSSLLIGQFIPDAPVARVTRMSAPTKRPRSIDDYNVIFARNLFNSQGLIPDDDSPSGDIPDSGGPAVRTTLPFNLIGTLILRNELRSIATIEDKSASMVYPVRVSDEIPSKAKILSIEAKRVIFINTSSGRREFVELPEDAAVSNARISLGAPRGASGAGIEKTSPTNFNVARTEVDKAFSDLNNILTQARAVPNFENGVPSGYKLFQIVPGSIYDKLGLQNGDVIAGVNGEAINDPGKAFELLGQLKTSPHLDITIKRDGKSQSFSYDIR